MTVAKTTNPKREAMRNTRPSVSMGININSRSKTPQCAIHPPKLIQWNWYVLFNEKSKLNRNSEVMSLGWNKGATDFENFAPA